MGWLKRYRHSRGFGVHSPFAFRFITEVITERLPYYDYAHLPERLPRLVYRIACRFQPSTFFADGDAGMPVVMACPKATPCGYLPCDMVVATVGSNIDAITQALNTCKVVIAYGSGDAFLQLKTELTIALDNLGHGMSFDNERDCIILVPDAKLPRQHFAVKY